MPDYDEKDERCDLLSQRIKELENVISMAITILDSADVDMELWARVDAALEVLRACQGGRSDAYLEKNDPEL